MAERVGLIYKRYDVNATNSPLLRLPPEVRNRIWYFVLCGKMIHAAGYYDDDDRRRPRATHAICCAAIDDESTAAEIRSWSETDGDPEWHAGYFERHGACKLVSWSKQNSPRIFLPILEVCRQIHREAALLPFKHNTFSFGGLRTLEAFLKALVPAQAYAIEAMTIVLRGEGTEGLENPYDTPYSTVTFTNLLRSKMKGLKKLLSFVEFPENTYAGHFARSSATKTAWTASITQFEHLSIVSATVAAANVKSRYLSTDRGSSLTPQVSPQTARTWAKEMGERLTAPAA